MTRTDYQLDDQVYEQFRTLVLERSGLYFPDRRRQDFEWGVLRAFSQEEQPDLMDYYQNLVHTATEGPEWKQLLCQITVGESYFFRNQPQLRALQQHVFPEIIARKRKLGRQLRIWSAGCSTGEEPYSIAMLLRELVPDLSSWNLTILASDINREALTKARQGLYGAWSFREKDWGHLQDRYFARRGKQWELSPDIRDMVTFTYLNLVEDTYPSMTNNTVAFDLILCRNVTIYFTQEITEKVVHRFHKALVEGGWLVVGHSEPSLLTYTLFETRNFPGAILYQKQKYLDPAEPSWLSALEQTPPPRSKPIPTPNLVPTRPKPREAKPRRSAAGNGTKPTATQEPASDTTPAGLCIEVEHLLKEGQVEKSLELLRQAMDKDPQCARPYYLVAKIRANAGLWEEAQRWCEQAIERDSLLTEAHFLLSMIHGQKGDLQQALASMKRVVYLERNAILGHFGLANLYRELGDPARTRKYLQNTARLLADLPADVPIRWSDGMTAGRLRHVVLQELETKEKSLNGKTGYSN